MLVLKNAIVCMKKDKSSNKNYAIVIFIVALCTAFVFSWGVTNTGTATRHRDKMIVVYAVLYSLSHYNCRDKKVYLKNLRIL